MGRIPPHRHAFHLRYARALAGGTHNGGSIAARIYHVHKVLTRLEKVCLRDAAAVVSLTDAAVGYLQDQYPAELQRTAHCRYSDLCRSSALQAIR